MNIQMHTPYSTPLSNSTLLPLLLLSISRQEYTPKIASSIKEEYDYIVVGGGAAGSVVATRLSEESCVSVLLIEAGPENPPLTEVPSMGRFFLGSAVDWQFMTVPQKHSASGFVNRQIPWSTGKMLGGSASLNGMAYVRGNSRDYDNWAAQGARGWSARDIFPYFLKLEDNRTPAFLANGYHTTGGPITVSQPRYQPELKQAAAAAALELGYQFVDPNAAMQTGWYDLQSNNRDNQRCSPVKGYLVPGSKRNNLDIIVNSMVTRILTEDNRAVGVEFFNGRYHQVRAKREVIVSAGAVNTPKILLLSGIGPKEELNKLNIPVVADLPVGKNFHDHIGTHYFFTMDPNFRSIDEKLADPASISQYIASRSGPLATTDNLLIAFLYGLNVTAPVDSPNHEVYFGELPSSFPKKFGLRPEVYEQFFGPYENRPIFRCTPQDLHPLSRGTVTISSNNPFDPPVIDPNYLQVPSDVEALVDGLKVCKRLLQTEPMRRLGAKPFETLMPGCEQFAGDDDAYFRCFANVFVFTFHHPAGAAKMGDPSDPTTVVDPELRVKNVEGLRVVDASIMPQVPSGNIHMPVLMVAEKASDMIKQSIACPKVHPLFPFWLENLRRLMD